MALDLRDLLRTEVRVHPRLVQQQLFARPEDGARIAASLPPLVAFGEAQYDGGVWVVDWDHRLPSRHVVLRLYAHYTAERRPEVDASYAIRQDETARDDLSREFDVSDLTSLPADEAYEAEMDLGGSPARLKLVSEWRRDIQPGPAARAIDIVRES